MIKPTIFVGLGTTGTDILKILRELMSEEYEKAGLPIFRYISIETKDTETGENRKHFEDFERIQVVNAIIESTAAIRSQLEPNQPSYSTELAKWLNPDLLYEIQSFMDGAGNIRMAGRLCLWHNWEIDSEYTVPSHVVISLKTIISEELQICLRNIMRQKI